MKRIVLDCSGPPKDCERCIFNKINGCSAPSWMMDCRDKGGVWIIEDDGCDKEIKLYHRQGYLDCWYDADVIEKFRAAGYTINCFQGRAYIEGLKLGG
jgi:hypothetical protein